MQDILSEKIGVLKLLTVWKVSKHDNPRKSRPDPSFPRKRESTLGSRMDSRFRGNDEKVDPRMSEFLKNVGFQTALSLPHLFIYY